MSGVFCPIRIGGFSVERDVEPRDADAPPVVRIVLDRCKLEVETAVAFVLRGDERRLAVAQLRLLAELEPGEVHLDAVGQFSAVARRHAAADGSVTLERFDLALVEKPEIPLDHADAVADAIEWLVALGGYPPALSRLPHPNETKESSR